MLILGIDPGTARTGYGVVDISTNRKPKLLETNVIVTHTDLEMPQRLKLLHKYLNEVSDKFSPKIMVIEKLFFNANAKTAISVGQARGVVMLVAAEYKMTVEEYTALQVKKELAGHGRADKKVMQETVKNLLGLDTIIKSDDANDAVAIALYYARKHWKHSK